MFMFSAIQDQKPVSIEPAFTGSNPLASLLKNDSQTNLPTNLKITENAETVENGSQNEKVSQNTQSEGSKQSNTFINGSFVNGMNSMEKATTPDLPKPTPVSFELFVSELVLWLLIFNAILVCESHRNG